MKKLTVGMATYDDFDGVFFSVQAIRMYHPEVMDQVEILVVDNNPDSPSGKAVKKYMEASVPNGRYIPFKKFKSNFVKERVFVEAEGEFVLCIDCHVLLPPGALRKLIAYYELFPNTNDLIQGPMWHDNLKDCSTHFKPRWRGGMYGTWDTDQELLDRGDAFEIPMQGCGLLSCKKENWVGFNPDFRGFGGEEWYIQEKFRKYGGRAICLPFLKWNHRFGRPAGAPFKVNIEDKIRNYFLGWMELYNNIEHPGIQEMLNSFTESGHGEVVDKVVRSFFDSFQISK